MPYIRPSEREILDKWLVPLIEEIANVGELNYAITILLLNFVGETPRYHDYNEVIGVLECVKQEFYRRAVARYENKAKEANGDLF